MAGRRKRRRRGRHKTFLTRKQQKAIFYKLAHGLLSITKFGIKKGYQAGKFGAKKGYDITKSGIKTYKEETEKEKLWKRRKGISGYDKPKGITPSKQDIKFERPTGVFKTQYKGIGEKL